MAGTIAIGIWYFQLSNRHKAIVKTKLLHTFKMADQSERLKPLVPQALVLLQDFDRDNPYVGNNRNDTNLCTPIDLKNHSFPNEEGIRFAAHWVLPKGEHLYEFDVSY